LIRGVLSYATVASFTPVYRVPDDGISSNCPAGTGTTVRAGSASVSNPERRASRNAETAPAYVRPMTVS
jgi:hypothetical protein